MALSGDTVTLEMLERRVSELEFVDWLDHVSILEPPPGQGLIPFVKWPHLMNAIECFKVNRLICVLKSRQIGFSWLVAAYATWTALYHEGAVVLLFSQGELEAGELLGKCKTIHQYLPRHLQGVVVKENIKTLEFKNGSRIMAFPSTKDAGRGQTATLAIQDEADFHENADANTEALKPTLDAGGQLIQCSTVNKRVQVTLFKANYKGAPENGFATRFYGWDVRPSRDEAWYERVRAEAPTTDGMSPDLYMESAYPRNEIEALRPTRALAAFDPDVLDAMGSDIKAPVETLGVHNIYQLPSPGGRYTAGTDTSHGVSGDFSVTVVMNVVTGMVVADIMNSSLSPEELASASKKLLERYDSPIWIIEDNDWGILTIRMAESLGYPRLYHRNKENVGWRANNQTRTIMWGDLIEAVETRVITVPSQDGLQQFHDLIRNPDKGGRIEALVGSHDDYPTAIGLAWLGRDKAWASRQAEVNIMRPGRNGSRRRDRRGRRRR